MFEESDGVADVGVAGFVDGVFGASGFESKRALARSGTHFGRAEALVDPLGSLKAVEACSGENKGVALSGG